MQNVLIFYFSVLLAEIKDSWVLTVVRARAGCMVAAAAAAAIHGVHGCGCTAVESAVHVHSRNAESATQLAAAR